ncbi:MAG TPA: zinc ribbon domain-containing protein [Micromonosporaceae bacterium]
MTRAVPAPSESIGSHNHCSDTTDGRPSPSRRSRRILVGVCDTCGNDVEALRGSAETELVVCPLCGPAQVRLPDDACAVRPLGPWTDWRAGGVGQVLFAPLRAGVLPGAGPVRIGLRMNGCTTHTVTDWSGEHPRVLEQLIPRFLPRDTYFIQYALARASTLVFGRVRVIVHGRSD